jgi:hypothetical protein
MAMASFTLFKLTAGNIIRPKEMPSFFEVHAWTSSKSMLGGYCCPSGLIIAPSMTNRSWIASLGLKVTFMDGVVSFFGGFLEQVE